ncbi:Glycosyl hydrolases family 31 protein [Prunus dulcis]|uniref:Glycosyl hydrolases family 31 protein n=1 Tax=Prunus dulcis TaxID=3755 RepID=A0A4Y1REN0_PRUDU|nr:Glycosyl hydrolases family 31 protein [Prunus dulcis]
MGLRCSCSRQFPSSPINLPLLLPSLNFTSRSSVSYSPTHTMPQAQPPLPALASVRLPLTTRVLLTLHQPVPCLLLLRAHHLCHPLSPRLPSPPPSAIPSINLLTSSPSRSKDPHRKIVFLYVVPISSVSVSNTHLMATRAKTSVRKPNPKYAHHALVSTDDTIEPTSFSQANKLKEWHLAMADEFNAFLRVGTWTLIPRTPTMNVLPNKWVFLVKRNYDGTIQRYKARLVANVFINNRALTTLHVQNAFLHGYLVEEVYMHQPVGFVDPTYHDHLGFIASKSDSSFFVYIQGSIHIYLLIYVDDILVTGSDPSSIATLISNLALQFSMKDLGPANYFLGMELICTLSGLSLTHTKYVVDLLKRVCQFMHQPTIVHWLTFKRILHYLNGTLTQGVLRSNVVFLAQVLRWNIASLPTLPPLSHGYVLYFPIFIFQLLVPSFGVIILVLSLASNPVFHSRTHHVEVDYHFVHERVVRNGLLVANCSTIDQITDIFNRGLSPARFSLLLSKLPVLHLPISLRGVMDLNPDPILI